jgi:hypothetical protein
MEAKDQLDWAIRERRLDRFNGLFVRHMQIDDELWGTDQVARRLADTVPGGYSAVIERFRFSVKAGGFGPHPALRWYGPRRRAAVHLLDVWSVVGRPFEPGQYPLRPSTLTVEIMPQAMLARRSVWAHWIAAQGWPVPPEFAKSIPALLPQSPPGIRTNRIMPANIEQRGGRPDVVRRAVTDFWTGLSADERRWSNSKLAMIYIAKKSGPGEEGTVRRHIANLKEAAKVV